MNPSDETFMCSDGIERSLYDIFMDGTSVFSFSITDVPETVKEYLSLTESAIEEYDCLAFHQANRFILKQITRKLKAPKEKVLISLDRFGNTGGMSIPLTLCDHFGDTEAVSYTHLDVYKRQLYYNQATHTWELMAPSSINYATKEISVTLSGTTPFTIVYKK